jgi:hypothetical protein
MKKTPAGLRWRGFFAYLNAYLRGTIANCGEVA